MILSKDGLEPKTGAVMVVGGGVGGQRAALDLAEAGVKVYLVETATSIGGKVAQLGMMFPTHDCVLCRGSSEHGHGCSRPTISPAFLDHSKHPNIEIMTRTEIQDVSGTAGRFVVTLKHNPRYVDPVRCTSCGACEKVCPVERPSQFQLGLSMRKAIFKTAPRAVPNAYAIEKGDYCRDCNKCVEACEPGAINLAEEPRLEEVRVGAIILAVGYKLYEPELSEEFGYGRYPNVVTSLQFERLLSRSGPTFGLPKRPYDGKIPQRIAWLQCVGSRDQKHSYCSSICCMYATKEAMLVKQRALDAYCQIFMMDERAFNKEYNAYYDRAKENFNVKYTRCRVSNLKEDPFTKDVLVRYQTEDGELKTDPFDLVVLSVGTEPPPRVVALAEKLGILLNESGFCRTQKFDPLQTSRPGIYVCGSFSGPKEIAETVAEAGGAAAQALRLLSRARGTLDATRVYPAERAVEGEMPRLGVFVCTCGTDISKIVDVDQVMSEAEKLPDVAYVEKVAYGCEPETRQQIAERMSQYGLNRLVMVGCSPRTHEALFQNVLREAGLNYNLLEMANVRDQCAWVHPAEPEKATVKAKELTAMSVARARLLQPITTYTVEPIRSVLVTGGGVTGLTAALTIASEGFEVYLVEKEEELGGNLRHLYYTAEGADPQQFLKQLIEQVESNDRIVVLRNTELARCTGSVGDFRSTLVRKVGGNGDRVEVEIQHGAIVVATGGLESRPAQYLLGEDERVMTPHDLESMIVRRPEKVKSAKSVVMIQCVRPEGKSSDYCSRVCCTNTVKNALKIKEMSPGTEVYVLYKDLITYGFREQFYTEARRKGVVFVRYTDERRPDVKVEGDQLRVDVYEPVLRERMTLNPDLLVLSTAVVPSPTNVQLASILSLPLSREGFFLEAHLKMRPIDFITPGIFLAGIAHYPKFIEECIAQAAGVSARVASILSKDQASFRGEIAQVDETKCAACLTCVRVCPFDVPFINADGVAEVDPKKCQGCGTCTGECPAKAIRLFNYYDAQIMAKTRALAGRFAKIEEVAAVGE